MQCYTSWYTRKTLLSAFNSYCTNEWSWSPYEYLPRFNFCQFVLKLTLFANTYKNDLAKRTNLCEAISPLTHHTSLILDTTLYTGTGQDTPRPNETFKEILTLILWLRDTWYLWGKNSENMQLQDVLVCNLANNPSFQNPTKSSVGKKALFQILKRWYISWITGQNVQKLPIFAIFDS